MDNELRVDIEEDLSAEYTLQMLESLKLAIDERNTYIHKVKKESVAVSSKLVRGKLGMKKLIFKILK